MKVLVAMRPFKDALAADEACDFVQLGLKQAFNRMAPEGKRANYTSVSVPLPGKSEGFLAAVRPALTAQGFKEVKVAVCDPSLMHTLEVPLLVKSKECYLEAGLALGRKLTKAQMLTASSYGLGQLIAHALDLGCTDLKLSLGDVGCCDLGLGLMQALGVKFEGAPVVKNKKIKSEVAHVITPIMSWSKFTSFDDSVLKQRLRASGAKLTILTDHFIPLDGSEGPVGRLVMRHGAVSAQHKTLIQLFRLGNRLLAQHYGHDIQAQRGTGAGGGIAAALIYAMGAQVASSMETALDLLDIDHKLEEADLVITGEGFVQIKSIVFQAKAEGLAARAKKHKVPLWLLCGEMDNVASPKLLQDKGITAALSISHGTITLEEALPITGATLMSTAINAMIMALSVRK